MCDGILKKKKKKKRGGDGFCLVIIHISCAVDCGHTIIASYKLHYYLTIGTYTDPHNENQSPFYHLTPHNHHFKRSRATNETGIDDK
ncbi:hypothetical protein M569_09887 [Genlisea aurea]|uniref:Uncharacterized protein n=1 Tax=Genlisea aurea TaxID=192259 RepID=S8DY78_9LAMI|nr:hypothetical protein M569_09887 [Genlisea aurea]